MSSKKIVRNPTQFDKASLEDCFKLLQSSPHGLRHDEAVLRMRRQIPYSAAMSSRWLQWSWTRLAGDWQILHQVPFLAVILFMCITRPSNPSPWLGLLYYAFIFITELYCHFKQKKLLSLPEPKIRVLREDEETLIPISRLCHGDILQLTRGDLIPGPLKVIHSHSLKLISSDLIPMQLQSNDLIPGGCFVLSGSVRGLLLPSPEINHGQIKTNETKHQIPETISFLPFILSAPLFALCWYKKIPLVESLLFSLGLLAFASSAMVKVLLKLQFVRTLSRMNEAGVLIFNENSIGVLANLTHFASDSKSILTADELTARKVVTCDGQEFSITGTGMHAEGEWILHGKDHFRPLLRDMVKALYYSCNAQLKYENERWVSQGRPSEVALLALAQKFSQGRPKFTSHDSLPFQSQNMFSANLIEANSEWYCTSVGAPEKVIGQCTYMQTLQGALPIHRTTIEHLAHNLADEGLRIFGLAWRKLPSPQTQELLEELHSLTFLGLIALSDPLRPDARSNLESLRNLEVTFLLLGSDHLSTNVAISRELGLLKSLDEAMTSERMLDIEDPEDLYAALAFSKVFSRLTESQKIEVILSLRTRGKIVGFFADREGDYMISRVASLSVGNLQSSPNLIQKSAMALLKQPKLNFLIDGIAWARQHMKRQKSLIGWNSLFQILFCIAIFVKIYFWGSAKLWMLFAEFHLAFLFLLLSLIVAELLAKPYTENQ